MTQLNLGIISLFPEMFQALQVGITGRALQRQLLSLQFFNPRDFTTDKHGAVDDKPYGGGPGMVLQVQPLRDSIAAAKQKLGAKAPVIYLSPQGKRLNQASLSSLMAQAPLILLAGRYEGIDQRVIDTQVDEQWSIGDYILTGGELPAMVMVDAMTRLLPGALGDPESAQAESFTTGLLDHPHYTRPEMINEQKVPPVLLSGDHAAIERWRLKQALGRTWQARPDLLANKSLSELEQSLLTEFQHEAKELTDD